MVTMRLLEDSGSSFSVPKVPSLTCNRTGHRPRRGIVVVEAAHTTIGADQPVHLYMFTVLEDPVHPCMWKESSMRDLVRLPWLGIAASLSPWSSGLVPIQTAQVLRMEAKYRMPFQGVLDKPLDLLLVGTTI